MAEITEGVDVKIAPLEELAAVSGETIETLSQLATDTIQRLTRTDLEFVCFYGFTRESSIEGYLKNRLENGFKYELVPDIFPAELDNFVAAFRLVEVVAVQAPEVNSEDPQA